MTLKPFWRYYGGKYRAASRYPPPRERLIVEPFAGAAGYATRHHDLDVLLIDKNPIIAGIWAYLIRTPSAEIRRLPLVGPGGVHVETWPCDEAKHLAGFWLNDANVSPCITPSAWARKHGEGEHGAVWGGWGVRARDRVASQVDRIRHWRVICGDYTEAPDVPATWFIDPPYNGRAGKHYPVRDVDYDALGSWCRTRRGTVIVCEQAGATWMDWTHTLTLRSASGVNRPKTSAEVVAIDDAPLFRVTP